MSSLLQPQPLPLPLPLPPHMPLHNPPYSIHLSLPSTFHKSLLSFYPCRNKVFCISSSLKAQAGWRDPKQEQVVLAVDGEVSFAETRLHEPPAPLYSLARELFAQESARSGDCRIHNPQKLVFKAGDTARNQEKVTTFFLSLFTDGRSLPLLVLGVGAFFNLQSPAVAATARGLSGAAAADTVTAVRVSEILTSGWAGLMAGCLHALTGPDHLAALAPLCIGRAKLESAVVGALWGCGHNAGQVLFGLAFLLLKGKLHIELVRTWAARVVGVSLLAIGAMGLKEAQEIPISVPAGAGGSSADSGEVIENTKNTHRLKTFATGLVYGLQPDALLMILPALALPSRLAGAAYLGMFLAGTVIAMGSYTAFIGSCGQALQKRLPWITRRLTIGSSLIAIAFGIGVLLGELFGINLF